MISLAKVDSEADAETLGNGAVGIPSVLGLYFNVFHPLIQAFIFVTLTLTFINEATE